MIQPYKYNKLTQLPCDNDIEQYTDIDLFQLLDLNNPTDRELEAKLYSLIEKYQTIKNNVGQQMKNFYISIFKHFFETEEDEEYNEVEEEKDPLLQNTKNQNNKERTGVGNLKEGFETKRNPGEPTQSNNNDPPTYTKNVDYTRGSLNPILKETIKRVVSIDSSFRNKKTYPISTEFTFNLTETLHDVVSLKLYSVSIPYNWYTINQNFGSNFFYIKGISNGIDNNNFEYKIDIGYGNYTDTNLISTVNNSIKTNFIDKNPDISFGETKVEHSTIDGRCKFTMDIKNIYNETNYYLHFPNTVTYTNPANVDSSKNSIPELFGYTKKSYHPFSVYSSTFTKNNNSNVKTNNNLELDYINSSLYIFKTTTNYFEVHIYEGDIHDKKITSYDFTKIIETIKVTLFPNEITNPNSLYSYTGTQIFEELNTQLGLHEKLMQSNDDSDNKISSTIKAVKFNQSSYETGDNVYVFELSIRPNRRQTVNFLNQKMIIIFQDENIFNNDKVITNTVWRGDSSLFVFPNNIEFQNINAEVESSTTRYLVNSQPYILLRCIRNEYCTITTPDTGNLNGGTYIANDLFGTAVDINDYKITIPDSSDSGYILTEYYKKIQNSIDNLSTSTLGQVTGKISNINNYTTLEFSINTQINTENFYIDTTNSFLQTIFKFPEKIYGGYITSKIGFTTTYEVKNNENRFKICSKPTTSTNPAKSYLTNCVCAIKPGTYTIGNLQEEIRTTLNDFSQNNINLSKCSLICSIDQGEFINIGFTINIQANLTNSDYVLYFFDTKSIEYPPPDNSEDNIDNLYYVYYYITNYKDYGNSRYYYKWKSDSSNSWKYHFGFMDPSYSLIQSITGETTNTRNELVLTNANNTFELRPIYNPIGGVYNIKTNANSNSNNVISFTLTLPVGSTYSKKQITEDINDLLYNNLLTRGSYINTDTLITTIRLNINKVFTTKDYSLVFYDVNTFTRCNYGSHSSAQVTTADTTLGWRMGFRSSTFYNMTPENVTTNPQDNTTYYGNNISNTYTYNASTNIVTLTGDTSVNVNLYNYFLIVLDDYTQNHLNDGLITTTIADTDVPLPSYATKASRKCVVSVNKEGVSDTSSYQNKNSLTNAQLYSANQLLNTKMTKYTKNIFSNGPFVQDIFGMIPIKTAGLSPGQTYSEFGGSLQIQERVYFGPVNISRMTVRIITDKGNVLDLNNVDWAFSLITEQLYNPNKR